MPRGTESSSHKNLSNSSCKWSHYSSLEMMMMYIQHLQTLPIIYRVLHSLVIEMQCLILIVDFSWFQWSTWDQKQYTLPGNNQPNLAVTPLVFSLSPYFFHFKVDFQLTKSRETETISPNAFLYYTFSRAFRVVLAHFFLDAFINQKISNSLSGNPFGFRAIPSLSLLVNLNSGLVLLV